MKRAALLGFVSFDLVLAADILTKYLFFVPDGGARPIFSIPPHLVSLIDHKNFGLIADARVPLYAIILISILILAALAYEAVRAIQKNAVIESVSLCIAIAGAVGNLLDRIAFGYVRDWLLFFNTSALNLADIAIAGGIIVYLASLAARRPRNQV